VALQLALQSKTTSINGAPSLSTLLYNPQKFKTMPTKSIYGPPS